MLAPGTIAPDFVARTLQGKTFYLSQLRGKPVWLIFYRYPTCPMCNLHFFALLNKKEYLNRSGLQLVTVFESRADLFPPKKLAGRPYSADPIVPDPQKKLYELYRVKRGGLLSWFNPFVFIALVKSIMSGFPQGRVNGSLSQLPAHFLINEDGAIEDAYYGENIADHIPWKRVVDFVQKRLPDDTQIPKKDVGLPQDKTLLLTDVWRSEKAQDKKVSSPRPAPVIQVSPPEPRGYLLCVSAPQNSENEYKVSDISSPIVKRIKIGRTGDYTFPSDSACAEEHFEIIFAPDAVWIYDLNSPQGTFINGRRIPALEPVTFALGSTLTFGNQYLVHSPTPYVDPSVLRKPVIVVKSQDDVAGRILDVAKTYERYGSDFAGLMTPKELVNYFNSQSSNLHYVLVGGGEETVTIPVI